MKDLLTALKDSTTQLVAIDPGETTGICRFEGPNLVDARQLVTDEPGIGAARVRDYINESHPEYVIMESYRVYAWKTEDHTWNSMHTSQLIGAIKYLCSEMRPSIPVVMQSAQIAKGFVTDDKLKAWGLWIKGQKHARDAIRHAVYYLLFQVAEVHKLPTRTGG